MEGAFASSSELPVVERDCSFGSRPALPVPNGEPDWDSGSPKTAEEYLKRVRWEAAQCIQTTRSEIDTVMFEEKQTEYIPQVKTVAHAPAYCQPTTAWMKQTLAAFHKLRRHFENLDNQNEDGELLLHESLLEPSKQGDNSTLEMSDFEHYPSMKDIEAFDQVETSQLLRLHIADFLKLDLHQLTDIKCYWLYALYGRIHRPLHDTMAATTRSLFKHCSHLRARWARMLENGEISSQEEVLLPKINLLMAISGVYFGQDEALSGMIDVDDLPKA